MVSSAHVPQMLALQRCASGPGLLSTHYALTLLGPLDLRLEVSKGEASEVITGQHFI